MTNIVGIIISNAAITSLILFIFKESIKAKIKHQYDLVIENYKNDLIKKQKAALVAELIAEWLSYPENFKKLNQLTLEAFMWLPHETALDLSKLLSADKDSPQLRDIIEHVREIILGPEEKIDSNSIILFIHPRK
jgi:hypothetical protein